MKLGRLLLLLLLGLVAIALNAEQPKIPADAEDLLLTKGKSANEYFGDRAKQTECRNTLNTLVTTYRHRKAQLRKLLVSSLENHSGLTKEQKELLPKDFNAFLRTGVDLQRFLTSAQSDRIDSEEEKIRTAREAMRSQMEACGWCATRQLIQHPPIETAVGTENWYESDGSCFLPAQGSSPEEKSHWGQATHKILSDSLVSLRHNSKRYGGFTHLLEYRGKDANTLFIDAQNPWTYIAVRGLQLGPIEVIYSYYFRNTLRNIDGEDRKIFAQEFQSGPRPEKFEVVHTVRDVRASHRFKIRRPVELSSIKGKWFLLSTDKGEYLRYWNAADLSLDVGGFFNLAEAQARGIHIDTLVEMAERILER